MKLIKRIKFNFKYGREYKEIEEELELLECYFDNRSEAMACLGDEYTEDANYNKYDNKYKELVKRMKQVKAIEEGFKRK